MKKEGKLRKPGKHNRWDGTNIYLKHVYTHQEAFIALRPVLQARVTERRIQRSPWERGAALFLRAELQPFELWNTDRMDVICVEYDSDLPYSFGSSLFFERVSWVFPNA